MVDLKLHSKRSQSLDSERSNRAAVTDRACEVRNSVLSWYFVTWMRIYT
jgi:hypothetical protein